MPGVFHTELVPSLEGSWKVYLLSENLREATTRRSSVSGYLETERGKSLLQCTPLKDHFLCTPDTKLSSGKPVLLRLESRRAGGPAGVATYRLPLKWRE